MYYLRARYYSPAIMRFVSEDSYRGSLISPLSLNYYLYCLSNPVMMYDPSGNWPNWAQNAGNWIKNKATDIINKSKKMANAVGDWAGSVDWAQVGEGALQMIGGGFEFAAGLGIATGGTATGPGAVLAWAGGGYLMVDGASNVTGGFSKIKNALVRNGKGEPWNFIKNSYEFVSPEYGGEIYNITQGVIAIYCISSGLKELPKNFSKSNWSVGLKQLNKGMKTCVQYTKEGGKLIRKVFIYDTNTFVNSFGVNGTKLTTGILSLGTDLINSDGLIRSYFRNDEDEE